jgi:hypothetical protein
VNSTRLRVALQWIALATLIAAGAVATHLPYVLASDCLDADATIVTLMGRHFAHGEIVPFFWGQRYMGALEAWVLAPWSWLAGPSGLVASCLVALALTAVQAVFVARITARAHGRVFVAVMLVVTTSALTAFAQTTLYGGRLAATALVLAALDTIQGVSTGRRAVVAGALTGAALYGDHMMLVWALPIAFTAYRARTLGRFVLAAAPWLVFDRVCFALTTGPRPGVADPWEWPRNLHLFVVDGLPMMFGADWAAARRGDFVRPGPTGAWVVLSLAMAVFAAWAIAWLASHWRANGIAELLFVPLATAGIFVLAAQDVQSMRYLPPAWPAVAILAGLAAASRPALGFIGAVVAAANMAVSVAEGTVHAHGGASGRACRAELSATASAVRGAGVGGVWADYWDAYPLALFMDERVPFAPFRGVDRRPAWTSLVRDARPVAYLLTNERAPSTLRDALDHLTAPRRVGRYDLYVLPESLPAGPLPP